MGACILCGKSAGFFYSLHKECFEKYESSEAILVKAISDQLASVETDQLAGNLDAQVAEFNFSGEASKRTLIRALEKFSANNLDNLSDQEFTAWLNLLEKLSLDESLFLNSNFIVQQMNYPLVRALHAGELPSSNANPANFNVQLNTDERLWWCFSSSHVETVIPKPEQKKWSVLNQIMSNMFSSRKNNRLEVEELGEGKIWLSNQCFSYESNLGVTRFEYEHIYACTPVKNGVKIQLKDMNSRTLTYYCEDGRLLYAFIQFALKN